jgi:tetratricopeptide (TPR) repeat protein
VLGAGDPETGALAGLAAAEAALRMRRDAEALDALRVIEGLPVPEPLREAALLDRGVLTVRAGAWKEAIGILEPLAPRIADPARQSLARRALGTARYHLGEHAGASQEFRRSLHLARAESSAWIGLGLSALAQRRLAEAEEAFAHARASADPPTAAAAAHGLVLVAIQRGDEAAFATRAAAFVDADPAHEAVPGLLCRLAATAVSRGEIERAERWVTRLVLDHPRSEHAREALRHFGAATEGRPGVGRRVYDAILARPVPDWLRLDALFGLAEAGLALGDAADAQRAAEAFLREAPAGDPRIPTAFARLVRIHEAQGRHGLALRTAESFLARFPDEPLGPRVELVRGRLLVAEGRWESAQRSLEAARDRGEPEVAAEAHFWLGETLRARGDLGAATAVYLGASRLYPQTMWAARGLQGAARSYLDRGMPAEAAALLREITVQPAAEPALVDWARDGLRRLGAEPPPEARDHIRRVPGARP